MKKIIVFSSHTTTESGGVGTHLKHLINEVNQSDFESKIILGASKLNLIKINLIRILLSFFVSKDTNEIIFLNLYILALKNTLTKSIKSIKTNDLDELVIHCHDKQTAIASLLIKNNYQFRIKVLQTLHAPFSEQYRITNSKNNELISFSEILDSGSSIYIDKLIGVDLLQVDIAKKIVDFKEDKTVAIANAVDTKELDTVQKGNVNEKKYFIIARHLHTKNGVIYAVKAFEKFLKNYNDYDLLIMGDGPEKGEIESYINKNNLQNNIKLIGRKSHHDSLKYIFNSEASIIPSIPIGVYIEATSLTMLESMYLRVPVVASNIGGLAEVIENRKSGLLFEPKNINEIVSLLETVVKDKELVISIKDNARLEILNNFSSNQWFKKISMNY